MSDLLSVAIAAYHDGTLDAEGAALLTTALRGPEAAAVRSRLALDGLLAQAFTADDAVVRSVRERIEGERSASAVVRAVRGSLAVNTRRQQRRPRRAAWLPRLMTAALVLLMVGVVGWLFVVADSERPLCRLMAMDPVVVVRHAKSVTVTPGAGLYAGDRVRPTTAVTLVWQDGSRLLLQPDALVVLRTTRNDHGVHLELGGLSAEIAKQRPDRAFVITTEEARVDVVGTRFHVIAGAQRTQVDLHQGSVRLTRVSDGRALTLRADESAVVAANEDFVVRSRATPTPVVPPSTPTIPQEPAWTPLFSASDLAAWEQQHGSWSNTHGTVRGSDSHHGKARLLGRHPFADLELNCRLRITGVEFAEVQVGNYNWFVEVPAHGTEWIQVAVRQRGEQLTITADGVTLKLKPGDGAAMRAGPLAFYVMPGGTLEISEAKFRVPLSEPPTTR